MLNLEPIFNHAIAAFEEFSDALEIRPLPAAIYLMQRDVVNHYEYAITHYFPIPLSMPYLQNSSIGSPYEKWRKFTNDDFDLLAFAIHNLIRYTSRFVYETVGVGLQKQNRHREIKSLMGDRYTKPLCDIRLYGRQIGITVLPANANALEVTPFAESLVPARTDIGDRQILDEICELCRSELSVLADLNSRFGALCTTFQNQGPVTVPYDSINEGWWT